MVFSVAGCVWWAGPGAGGLDAGGAGSVSLPGSEKGSGSPGAPHGGENPRGSGSGYRLVAQKDYLYGSGPDDFGIERGMPAVACGGFSAGGSEENLYVLDLVNRNIKVLRKTDATLLKVVKLSCEVMGSDTDLAVDGNGTIYVLVVDADGTVRVVAFDDTGKVLSVYRIPEGVVGERPVTGTTRLVKIREGQVVLCLVDHDPQSGAALYSFYSFRDGRFMKLRYRVDIEDGWNGRVLGVSRLEGDSVAWVGRYRSEGAILTAHFVGEDGLGNVCVQVEESPFRPESLGLGVLRFSKEGRLLDSLFFPEGDYRWYSSRLLNIGRDGTVYQVIPAEKFLKVRVWVLR